MGEDEPVFVAQAAGNQNIYYASLDGTDIRRSYGTNESLFGTMFNPSFGRRPAYPGVIAMNTNDQKGDNQIYVQRDFGASLIGPIAGPGMAVPGSDGAIFTAVSELSADGPGHVAFFGEGAEADGQPIQGLHLYDGELPLKKVVYTNSAAPEGLGNFVNFYDPANPQKDSFFNPTLVSDGDEDDASFHAVLESGASGAFARVDGQLLKLLDTNQNLFGRTISSIELGAVSLVAVEGASQRRSVLYVQFTDGYKGLYLASIE